MLEGSAAAAEGCRRRRAHSRSQPIDAAVDADGYLCILCARSAGAGGGTDALVNAGDCTMLLTSGRPCRTDSYRASSPWGSCAAMLRAGSPAPAFWARIRAGMVGTIPAVGARQRRPRSLYARHATVPRHQRDGLSKSVRTAGPSRGKKKNLLGPPSVDQQTGGMRESKSRHSNLGFGQCVERRSLTRRFLRVLQLGGLFLWEGFRPGDDPDIEGMLTAFGALWRRLT